MADLVELVLLIDKTFIHIPKTGGTSVRETLWGATAFPHKRLKDFDNWQKLDTFTIIRNPWDRAVSLCGHLHQERKLTKEIFENWLVKSGGDTPRLYKNYDISLGDAQADFITINGKIEVQTILKFEDLSEEFRKEFGLGLLRINVGKRNRDYREYYTEQSYNLITSRYQQDINLLGYTF